MTTPALPVDNDAPLLESPVFMVGSARSGTSLLRLMIGHHPRIAANPEFGMAVDALGPNGEFPALEDYYAWLARDRIANLYGFEVDRRLDYPHLVDSFLRQRAIREGKPIATATVHHRYDLVLRIWPDARFIYILRDGRDVARSVIHMGWAGNVWYGCQRWIDAEDRWARFAPTLPPERVLEVRYERLILEPRAELERICAFYGVAYDDAIFDYTKSSRYGEPDPDLVQQWKRKLGAYELQQLDARIGARLAARGYEPSGVPPLRFGPLRRARLALQNWVWKARFRARRYGVGLFVLDYAARRLGLRALERRTRARIQAIVNEGLR
ncbi:MAG: sulfotransferase [Myxococcota bacterium]